MSPQLRGIGFTGPQQQRGAIGLMAAVTLGMVLLFMLLVVDSGRLYLEQRKLQRVADMAVLEAVSRLGTCGSGATAASYANQSAIRNSFTPGAVQKINTTCGSLSTNSSQLRVFTADANKSDAIRVIATTTVPTSVAGGLWSLFSKDGFNLNTNLTASAVGSNGGAPLAALTIRSSLGTIDSSKSELLNGLIGGLLGGKLNLSLASWQGLATTDINLLSYLNQLAINLNLKAGDYNQLLNTNVTPTQLINAAVNVLEKNGAGATVALQGLKVISLIASNTQILKLGDLIKIQNGTSTAGLDTNLKVLDLLQGAVQLANGKSAVAANITTNIPLVGNVTVSLKIIEPPQMSAVGNPALAIIDPLNGGNRIYVKTAQVQTHIHIDLTVLKLVSEIASAVTQLLSPLTSIVNNLLELKLDAVLKCVLSTCDRTSLSIASSLDIYLEAASANSYVTAYNCAGSAPKSLTAQTSSAAAKLSIGLPPTNGAFPSTTVINQQNYLEVDPIKLISIDVTSCTSVFCGPREVGKGGTLGVKVQTQVGATSKPLTWTGANLPNVNTPPVYQSIDVNSNIIKSLGDSLSSNLLVSYTPQTGNITSTALTAVSGLINEVTGILSTALSGLLSNLLDPIIKTLLGALGISLGNADVGANLSCNQGGRAQLVL